MSSVEALRGYANAQVGKRTRSILTGAQKCDGQRPQCRICSISNKDCTYSSVRKRRGPPKGSNFARTNKAVPKPEREIGAENDSHEDSKSKTFHVEGALPTNLPLTLSNNEMTNFDTIFIDDHDVTLHSTGFSTDNAKDLYWRVVHPFWPVLYRPHIENAPVDATWGSAVAALVYRHIAAYGIGQAATEALPKASQKYKEACSTLRLDAEPSLCQVQTQFFLAMYCHTSSQLAQAWVHCGIAIRLIQSRHLHLKWLNNDREAQVAQQRVVFLVWIVEMLLAVEMSRAPSVRMKDIQLGLADLADSDETELWLPSQESTFVIAPGTRLHASSLINSYVILSSMFEMLCSYDIQALEVVKPTLLNNLDAWREAITPWPEASPQFKNCKSWEYTVRLMLSRPFIANPQDSELCRDAARGLWLLLEESQAMCIGLPPDVIFCFWTASGCLVELSQMAGANAITDLVLADKFRNALIQLGAR